MPCIFQPSIFEIARTPEFATLPILLEDFIKDNGGKYSSKCLFYSDKMPKVMIRAS